jgi:hypothetical protein
MYRTRAIIARGLYILNSLIERQKCLRGFFQKIISLCTIGI